MRNLNLIAAALVVAAAPLPVLAGELPHGPAAAPVGDETERAAEAMQRTLGDPATQARMAKAMGTVSEMMLDLPLAPMARAVAEAAGEDPRRVDPGLTLRQVAPAAADVPGEVREKLPRMMGAMAGMAGGMGQMMPALRQMADRMRATIDVAAREAQN